MALQIILNASQDSSQFKWFSVSLLTAVLLTRSWRALIIVRAGFRKLRRGKAFLSNLSHEDSLFYRFVYFWNCEQINPAYSITAGQLYIYKHYSRHFLLYQKNCAYERAKTKAHCKAKRNIFIRIEIQAGNPESAGQHFLVHWTVFCLAACAWSCSTAWRHKDCSSRVLDLVSFIVHCCKGAFPLSFFFSLIGWNVLLISCRLKLSWNIR